MRFLRWGEDGAERPGVFDLHNQILDLSGVIDSPSGDVLEHLIDVPNEDLPIIDSKPRLGCRDGNDPERFLKPGDVMELEIEGLGRQR